MSVIRGMNSQKQFIDWVERNMRERGWRPADLSRASGLSGATISHILNQDRAVGNRACIAIARAFGVAPEDALMIAGILPNRKEERAERQAAFDLINYLDEDEYQLVFEYIKWRFEEQKKRGEN